eukprot:TRINITY_DN5196_c0_g1_i2.p1 TRINITY_DN5196_c0_g1~~TRINITY_DN5196_c0_g1_i2.p1  ORF type:complete len:367 (-),score=58.57 TRINITY_DN5196_c0_g1_i2:476-1531(-)
MASSSKAQLLLLSVLLGIQLILSSALTEEEKLRAAIANPTVTSFQLISNIKLTSTLPPIELVDGSTRKFTLFSSKGFTISGAKKFRGLWTKVIDINTTPTSFLELTIDKVNLVDFRAKNQIGLDPFSAENGWGILGAAVRVRGTVKILNSLVTKNEADLDGGAIYVSEGSLLLKNSNFTSNLARRQGGAVAHLPSGAGTLTVEDCLFIGNKARPKTSSQRFFARGGALYHENLSLVTTIRITRTSFKSNTGFSGGAFFTFSNRSPVVFTTCSFDSNLAVGTDAEGGAMYLNYVNPLTFVGTTFSGNKMNTIANNIFIFWNFDDNPTTTITGLSAADAALVLGNTPGNFIIQ